MFYVGLTESHWKLYHNFQRTIQCTNYINGMGSHNVRTLYVLKLCFTLAWLNHIGNYIIISNVRFNVPII